MLITRPAVKYKTSRNLSRFISKVQSKLCSTAVLLIQKNNEDPFCLMVKNNQTFVIKLDRAHIYMVNSGNVRLFIITTCNLDTHMFYFLRFFYVSPFLNLRSSCNIFIRIQLIV